MSQQNQPYPDQSWSTPGTDSWRTPGTDPGYSPWADRDGQPGIGGRDGLPPAAPQGWAAPQHYPAPPYPAQSQPAPQYPPQSSPAYGQPQQYGGQPWTAPAPAPGRPVWKLVLGIVLAVWSGLALLSSLSRAGVMVAEASGRGAAYQLGNLIGVLLIIVLPAVLAWLLLRRRH